MRCSWDEIQTKSGILENIYFDVDDLCERQGTEESAGGDEEEVKKSMIETHIQKN